MARNHLKKRRRKKEKVVKAGFDKSLLILTLIFTFFGIVAVADVSSPQALTVFNDPYYFAKQQVLWAGLGLISLGVASILHYKIWKYLALPLFTATLILLIVVLLPGFGQKVLGARRWISFGPINFQPSEIAKLSLTLFIARQISDNEKLWKIIISIAIVVGLVMLQPDLGTTIIISTTAAIQLFVSGFPIIYLLGLGIGGGVITSLLIIFSDYRRERLMTFIRSSADPLGSSYHIRQILIALGSGGIIGVGLGQSKQKHLFLPETATDSVFAVIAEEIGFIGAGFLIILLSFYILKLVRVALRAPDIFSKSLAIGITAWIAGQTFLNLSSMLALTPLTGIPLPFFSYGGSSLTMILFSIGILLNISRHGAKKTA